MIECGEGTEVAVDQIELRRCVSGDAARLAAMYSADREALEPADPRFFEADGQLGRITRDWVAYQTVGYVVLDCGVVVGLVTFEDITPDGSTVIGYYIAADRRRHHVGTRAVELAIGTAFDELGLREMMADIEPDNVGSLKIVERLGFIDRGAIVIDGVSYRRWVLDRPHSAGSGGDSRQDRSGE